MHEAIQSNSIQKRLSRWLLVFEIAPWWLRVAEGTSECLTALGLFRNGSTRFQPHIHNENLLLCLPISQRFIEIRFNLNHSPCHLNPNTKHEAHSTARI